MSSTASLQRVRDHLERLHMDVALTNLESVLERGQKKQLLPVQVLDELLQRELAGRMQRRIQANFKFSGLPVVQRIEQFDFEAQPQLPRPTVEELATLRFMASAENVVFLGPCGVGKTHLATGLAVRALEEGHKAYFLTLHDLVSRARLARRRDQLHLLLRTIHRADLFVLDELGFLPLSADDATFLFKLINKRYQSGMSTIVTSNKSYGQWGQIFPDETLAVAILDRLLHHATTVSIRGESYRLRNRRDSGLSSLPNAHGDAS